MKPEKGIEGGDAHLDGMVKEAMFERDLRAVRSEPSSISGETIPSKGTVNAKPQQQEPA